jgi:hypothetical protein
MICALVVVAPIVVWFQALLLQAAVRMVNAILGGAAPPDGGFPGPAGYPGGDAQAWSPTGRAIPVPDVRRGMVIMFAVLMVFVTVRSVTFLLLALAAKGGPAAVAAHGRWAYLVDPDTRELVAALVSLVANVSMFSLLLPTSLGRAFLVMVFQCVILAGIALAFTFGLGFLFHAGVLPLPRFR